MIQESLLCKLVFVVYKEQKLSLSSYSGVPNKRDGPNKRDVTK